MTHRLPLHLRTPNSDSKPNFAKIGVHTTVLFINERFGLIVESIQWTSEFFLVKFTCYTECGVRPMLFTCTSNTHRQPVCKVMRTVIHAYVYQYKPEAWCLQSSCLFSVRHWNKALTAFWYHAGSFLSPACFMIFIFAFFIYCGRPALRLKQPQYGALANLCRFPLQQQGNCKGLWSGSGLLTNR